ncbi:MAG: response regulator [Firmicutes bacterium]|nr:response regulator [Bacillota bacterium]
MIKVLIVEDDPMVSEINQRFLEKIEGFSLYESVNTIEDAKDAILKGNPDLILLDIFFPQGRGIELIKWIRANDLKSDVILITADKSMDTVEEAFRYGAIDYLIKPFVFNRFKEALLQYKNRLKNFENIEKVEQNIIDKYTLNKETTDETSDIKDIKGFSKHTYQKVLNYIKSMNNKAFSAQEIADKIGVSRITARRYLDYLEREDKVILELEYGKVGRPKNKYRLND